MRNVIGAVSTVTFFGVILYWTWVYTHWSVFMALIAFILIGMAWGWGDDSKALYP